VFAELTNMIVENFKNDPEQRLGPTGLSIPTVIHGRNFSTRSLRREDWIVVPFLCGEHLPEVKVRLQARDKVAHVNKCGKRQEFILTH
jgi:CheY-specific phosphatase CheX